MLTIRITPGSPVPIYQQITTQVRHAASTGAVAEGEFLPSVRSLAEQLLIESLPGRGVAIAARRAGMGLTRAERQRRIDPAVTQLVHDAIAMDLTPDDVQAMLERKWKSLELEATKSRREAS